MNFFHSFRIKYKLTNLVNKASQTNNREAALCIETPNRSHFFVSTSLFRDALPRSHRHAGFHENNSSIPKLFLSSTNKSSNIISQVGICREHLAYVTKLYHYIRVLWWLQIWELWVCAAGPACSFGWKWCNMFQTSAFHTTQSSARTRCCSLNLFI